MDLYSSVRLRTKYPVTAKGVVRGRGLKTRRCDGCSGEKVKPNTHRRRGRDETVLSRRRRRCEHEFATSWRQFRRVVGVNTPVGSRDPLAAVL